MEYVIIWIAFGLISAIIANNKGQNGCTAFLIGALLGPFGLIIALVLPKKDEELVKRGKFKKCPFCAENIKLEAVKCRYCSSDIPEEFKCPSCKSVVDENDNVCRYCGTDFLEGFQCTSCNGMVGEDDTICKHCGEPFTD